MNKSFKFEVGDLVIGTKISNNAPCNGVRKSDWLFSIWVLEEHIGELFIILRQIAPEDIWHNHEEFENSIIESQRPTNAYICFGIEDQKEFVCIEWEMEKL